jgi:hypothetical protein
MLLVQKVIKENGELVITRKQEFYVKDHTELEKAREKLRKHYGKNVYFIFKETDHEPELIETEDII